MPNGLQPIEMEDFEAIKDTEARERILYTYIRQIHQSQIRIEEKLDERLTALEKRPLGDRVLSAVAGFFGGAAAVIADLLIKHRIR